MTATEIITMLSNLFEDREFLIGLISGGVSGVIVTFISWLITTRLLAPRLKVSRDIAYEIIDDVREQKDENGQVVKDSNGKPIEIRYQAYVYRIKLANISIRSAFDIRIFFRLRYNNHYATIELPYLPYLKNRKCITARIVIYLAKTIGLYQETYDNHRKIPFRLTDIRFSKIEGFNKPELIQKHATGELNLEDFRDDNTIVEFVVMAVDSISGAALRIVTKRYTQQDLDEHVKKGKFLDGKMRVYTDIEKNTSTE